MFFILLEKQVWMHVFEINTQIYNYITQIHTHTRTTYTQGLSKCKSGDLQRGLISRLDFLPELGYVYICYSILKPSNYVLSCTPSHMNLRCVTAPMATSSPHELIITPTSWLTLIFFISNSRCLSVADNLASRFLMAAILTFIIGLTYLCWLRAKIYLNTLLRFFFFCDLKCYLWFICLVLL